LGTPEVRLFESDDHKNLASAFHSGVADHIPFGVYRIEAYVGGFYPEIRYVSVYLQRMTVVVGLPLGREAMVLPVPPSLHGKVLGTLPSSKRSFVRLTGVFSSQSLESIIGSDGSFDFSIPTDGKYLLLVVSEDGILASRMIESPYTGSPLEIKIGGEILAPAR
jgi:hypothetical protein